MTLPAVPFRVSFRVEGTPVPKQSFRFNKNGRHFQPERVKTFAKLVGQKAKEAMNGQPPFDKDVTVSYVFRCGDRRRRDLDNLTKGISDAIKGIVIEDDEQILEAHIYLERGRKDPETVVLVESL